MYKQLACSDILVVALGTIVVSSLMSLALAGSIHDARTEACIWKGAKLAKAVIGYEQQNKAFPLASLASPDSKPGSQESRASWLVRCLSFTENHDFPRSDRAIVRGNESPFSMNAIPSMKIVEGYLCPSRSSTHLIDPVDYDMENLPARTSYFALTATHFCNVDGIGYPPKTNVRTLGDGIMTIPSGERRGGATRARKVTDGLSKTLLFCESVEDRYAAWVDGTTAWLVGAWPGNRMLPSDNSKEFLASINTGAAPYMSSDRWSGSSERRFGPSGNHQLVTHAYADGQCSSLSTDIDPKLYLQLISLDDAKTFCCGTGQLKNEKEIDGAPAVESVPEQQRVISLKKDVWGIDIPSAKDLWELEPLPIPKEIQNIGPIKRALIESTKNATNDTKTYGIMRKLHEVMTVGQALVVKGHGQPAFLAAHDAFLNGKDSVMEFDAGQEVSILFYTNSTFGLTIESIVLSGKEIEIKYRFGHTGPHSRSHLALISLPKLDSGRYDVKVVHLPYRQPVHKETARVYGIYRHTRVCKDCQFVVKDRKGI